MSRLVTAILAVFQEYPSSVIIMGDITVDWMNEVDRQPFLNFIINDNYLEQRISTCITDNRTLIDHLYTNLNKDKVYSGILETYFRYHKAIWASIKLRR